jgi:glyoxylase-like metal-dependent hydrolase (beta-lactamase superfamily II)
MMRKTGRRNTCLRCRVSKRSVVVKHRSLVVVFAFVWMFAGEAFAQDLEQPPPVEVSHLSGNLYQLRCNGNVGVIASIGEDGTLLVDTGYAATVAAVQEELQKLESGPVRIVVNTHGDGDHVGGNGVLGENAVIIGHTEVGRRMNSYFALPAVDTDGVPMVTLDAPATVHFNNDAIRLLPVPGGHTDGDLIVHFTESRVACVGDLVLLGTFPNAAPARGGDAQRLIEVLTEIHEILPADTTLVAAHGGAFTMAELEAYLDMVEGTVAAVQSDVDANHTLPEIVERNPLASWSEWESPEDGLSFEDWITEIYASLEGTGPQSICAALTVAMEQEGTEAAVARYRQLKKEEPENWSFAENELNMLGYQLLARDRIEDAIVIFQLNVEAFPDGFNTYDSLGEAFLLAGRTEAAIANYERSLELNPDNTNARTVLAQLTEN